MTTFVPIVIYLGAVVLGMLATYVVVRLAVTHAMVSVLNRVNLNALRGGSAEPNRPENADD